MMTKVKEIEIAVTSLPRQEYGKFRRWFFEQDWKKWNLEIEADSKSGKLDFLFHEATEAKKNNKLKAL
ncbi:MAG: hypothetical protein WCQ99_05920 [Pseudomonadota bacterium]